MEQSNHVTSDAASTVRTLVYLIDKVAFAMFVDLKPYLSVGSVREMLNKAMFDVKEVAVPSNAISTSAIRSTPKACSGFPFSCAFT